MSNIFIQWLSLESSRLFMFFIPQWTTLRPIQSFGKGYEEVLVSRVVGLF